ncbi:MAG: D-glycerate dehydrogenase [Bdellovibrionales bacterium]|nr:D-glycerate dehydrogenase [Oligoflexia bacterium]
MSETVVILAFKPTDLVFKQLNEKFKVIYNSERSMTSDELVQKANEFQASAILVSVNHFLIGERMRALPPSVKVIATSSVGFDHLDLNIAKEKGIVITYTPQVLSDCTADLAMMLILNVSRRAREYLQVMEAGWPLAFGQSEMLGTSLKGKKLGILGMGSIGRALATRAHAFGMEILYCNRHRLSPGLERGASFYADFSQLLPLCDVVSLNAPGNASTTKIMNSKTFALMKPGALLINVARGSLVDEEALIGALKSGQLGGAGLDVFQQEPAFDQRLLDFPHVFLTPHMGSATVETRNEMGLLAMNNLIAVLKGLPALTPVPVTP